MIANPFDEHLPTVPNAFATKTPASARKRKRDEERENTRSGRASAARKKAKLDRRAVKAIETGSRCAERQIRGYHGQQRDSPNTRNRFEVGSS
jgi:hypothetical protein